MVTEQAFDYRPMDVQMPVMDATKLAAFGKGECKKFAELFTLAGERIHRIRLQLHPGE